MLRVSGIELSFGEKKILDGVAFQVEPGETKALMGRSGSGKSCLLRGIVGLTAIQGGSVELEGQVLIEKGEARFEEWEIRRNIVLVAQLPNLLPHLTVEANVVIALRVAKGLLKREARELAREMCFLLGLKEVLSSFPEELSGGQLQRAHLARALVLQPPVLLLDEVTSAIDPQTTKEVVEALWRSRELRSGTRQAIVIVTHLVDFARDFADKILFLHDGRIHEEGVADVFPQTAKREETIEFFKETFVRGSGN